ncbi:MAG: hypothetical protein Q9160_007124 [Pyrenula sp. 1 TL-2023]
MRKPVFQLCISAAIFIRSAQSFGFTYYSNLNCADKIDYAEELTGPSKGCQTSHTDTLHPKKSIKVRITGDVDNALTTLFFDTEDCDPDHIIVQNDGTDDVAIDGGCVNYDYKSFQVVNICLDDAEDCMND